MSISILVNTSYLVAATLFLLGLQRMASPKTARSGIQWAGAGMLIATAATFFLPGLHNLALIAVALVLGTGLAEQIVDAYLGASFLGSYHTQRVQKIMDLEK